MDIVNEKFKYCIYKCSIEYKELLPFLDLMQYRPVEEIFATIRINVKDSTFIYFEYNPAWIAEIHKDILYYFMLVEAMKIVLHHPTRLGNSVGNVSSKISASNVTASLDINAHSSFKSVIQDLDWFNKTTGMKFTKDNLTYEIAYKCLVQSSTRLQNGNNNSMNGQGSAQDGVPNQSNQNSNSDESKPNQSKDNDQNKLNGQNKLSQRQLIEMHYSAINQLWQTQAYGDNLIVDDQIKREFDACGGIDAFSSNGYNKSYSYNTKKMILEANQLSFDVRSILRRYAADIRTQYVELSRMRYNRRYGLALPGYRHLYQSKVGICFDRSGSMNNLEDVKYAVGVVNSFLPHAEVWYCEWDTVCHGFSKVKLKFDKVSRSGGGTDPQCVIDYINEHNLKFNGLIFITDNEYNWSRPNLASKISILGTSDAVKCPPWCNYYFAMKDLLKI